MAVNNVKIQDYFIFKDEFNVDFCEGINIFIGNNGSGKTTLLRYLYENTDGAIYIPTTDLLSHSKGLMALDRENVAFSKRRN